MCKELQFKSMHPRRLYRLHTKHECCILQDTVETLFMWGGKRLHHVIANLIRKICAKFYQNQRRFVKDMTKHFGVFLFHSLNCCSLAKHEC